MDDEEAAAEEASPSPSPSPTSSPIPVATALAVADPVTVAAAPPGHVLTLALPIQKPAASPNVAVGGGGGREDAWSEGATSALIDAWGERFLALGRGSLRHPQWQEVADAVSSRDGYSKLPKSDVQCKNRIDTLKKKYKIERAKPGSSWPFFHRLDSLLAPIYKPTGNSASAAGNANANPGGRSAAPHTGLRVSFPQRTRTPLLSAAAKRRLSPQPSVSSESSDGFPPEAPIPAANGKRRRVEEGHGGDGDRAQGMRELAHAIWRLGEAYERVESAKLEQAAAMERQRLEFARELEAQRVQFFLKTQMELSQVKNRASCSSVPASGSASGGARRMAMVADAGTISNHHRRHRVRDGGRRFGLHPHYEYSRNNANANANANAAAAAAAAAAADGNSGETDDEEEEEDEEVEEESQ